ncbi:MAG: aconitate hydratase, partial [Chloroflexi bacterium]|nr:aconitate hydratase [Chloroflexota bacterium]
FEGRIHPQVKANYLASPMLFVAYALAGLVDIDLVNEPLGLDPNHQPVYLRDIWPSQQEIREAVAASLNPELFTRRYGEVFEGDEEWRTLPVPQGDLYAWEPDSTYVREVPFFQNMPKDPPPLRDIAGARALASLGDSVTTDHISPAGDISPKSPAGQYLVSKGVQPTDFNSYGARRGNHEVMMRGTFANVRLRNKLTPEREGPWTVYFPTSETTTIFDASIRYQAAGVPLIVLAGKEYGSGSSRDWAAKGPNLLGLKAAIAESFERIHRSNLVGMGVLPLQYLSGQNAQSLGLTGAETFDITGVAQGLKPGQEATVTARSKEGKVTTFKVRVRIDTPIEVEYFRHGGILHMVLRRILRESGAKI